jgi:hypothetical protein
MADGELREEPAHLLRAQLSGGAAVNKALEFGYPPPVGRQRLAGVVSHANGGFQLTVLVFPGGPSPRQAGYGRPGSRLGCWHRVGLGRPASWPREEPDGRRSRNELVHWRVGGAELVQEGASAGGQVWGVAVFLAEIQVPPHPLMISGPLGGRHPGQLQAVLVVRLELWGNQWHRNAHG